VTKIDIGGAYMNAEMTGETVILEMDRLLSNIAYKYMPELEPCVKNGKILVKLDRALYGCIQSVRLWHDQLTGVLEQLRFSRNPVDPCVLSKGHGTTRTIHTMFVEAPLITSARKVRANFHRRFGRFCWFVILVTHRTPVDRSVVILMPMMRSIIQYKRSP
jgi:hypothetical protein